MVQCGAASDEWWAIPIFGVKLGGERIITSLGNIVFVTSLSTSTCMRGSPDPRGRMGVRHLAALFAVCAAIASTQTHASSESLLDWSAVEEVLNNAISSKVFPGCVAAGNSRQCACAGSRTRSPAHLGCCTVRVPAGQIYLRAFGKLTYGDYFPPASPQHNPEVTVDTMYDLARCVRTPGWGMYPAVTRN